MCAIIHAFLFDSINKQMLLFQLVPQLQAEEVEGVLWVARVESGASQRKESYGHVEGEIP